MIQETEALLWTKHWLVFDLRQINQFEPGICKLGRIFCFEERPKWYFIESHKTLFILKLGNFWLLCTVKVKKCCCQAKYSVPLFSYVIWAQITYWCMLDLNAKGSYGVNLSDTDLVEFLYTKVSTMLTIITIIIAVVTANIYRSLLDTSNCTLPSQCPVILKINIRSRYYYGLNVCVLQRLYVEI